jgi:hypothetical protein
MAVAVVDRLFVVAYGATSPTDEEWSGYLGGRRSASYIH